MANLDEPTIRSLEIQAGLRDEVRRPEPGEEAPATLDLGRFGDLVTPILRDEVQVEAARGEAAESAEIASASNDDVLELELEGGIEWWTTPGDLAQFYADSTLAGARGAGALLQKDVLTIPPILPFGSLERGGGGLLTRAVRRFEVDLPKKGAMELARSLEERLDPGPGLYRCPNPNALGSRIGAPDQVTGGGPFLILLHGTASSTAGSFGALGEEEQRPDWRRLESRYGDRIFAFEHRSLSEGPGQNAVELARLLPPEAEIHLVSHSRGGLIGELLCRGNFGPHRPAFTDAELDLFLADSARKEEGKALRELQQILAQKSLRIERFVRVACPARGTLLASKRLDRYLSVMLNALGLLAGGKLSVPYQFLKALTIGLVKQRADPSVLPGLEAMMPSSPLLAVINGGDAISETDLSVIAGDAKGSGLVGKLKVFAANLFFRRDHDLVVDTRSMFHGAQRSRDRARYFFERHRTTSHFNYFENASTRGMLIKALEAEGRQIPEFDPLQVGVAPEGVRAISGKGIVPPERLESLESDRPVVVLVPGILGSRLKVDDNIVWKDLSDLLKGRFADLELKAGDRVAPAGLLEEGYQDLARFLVASHEVVPFGFDWRRAVDEAADELAALLERLAAATSQPIRLLAHSMGGLVARRMRTLHGDVWQKLSERPGFRLVMLGTPNGGSYAIASILLGRERLLRYLKMVSPTSDVQRIVGMFPGLYDMLPPQAAAPTRGGPNEEASEAPGDDAEGEDLYTRETWERWREIDSDLEIPDQEMLARARAFRRAIESEALDDKSILYVAGHSLQGTPCAVRVGKNLFGRKRLELHLSPDGDGRVLWRSGIPSELAQAGRVWYASEIVHGALANDRRIFPALRELLEQGRTDRLRRTEPITRGFSEGLIAREEPLLLPDDEDFAAAALGFEPRSRLRSRGRDSLRISIAHGSLHYADAPVAVGHYDDDLIIGGEAALDRALGGALRQRNALGLYPGPVGSGEAILSPDDPKRGALIVGLGPIGEVAPGKITRGMRQAVLRYATLVADFTDWPTADDGRRVVKVCSLLIGSGLGTGLSIDDSLLAVIEGVTEAIELLRQELGERAPRLVELRFIELYEHRAICACEALQRLVSIPRSGDETTLEIEAMMQRIEGGQNDIPCSDTGWYRRLQIAQEPVPGGGPEVETAAGENFGALKFTSLTERARAEVRLIPTQRRLIDGFVEHSIGDSAWRPEVARTLFELLIPNQLKEYAPNDQDLLLVVDQHAARYPWELIADGINDPLSVRSGMIRQLSSRVFRENPVTLSERVALVIGDPHTDDPRFPQLEGARREAENVGQQLEARGWQVASELSSRPDSIMIALVARPYRILHIAAHGIYDRQQPQASGVVLADGMLLTAAEVEQLRNVPELAFINCCHLGHIESPPKETVQFRNLLAANLGLKLIQIGVRAVVIAGWVVNDLAAATFAEAFYSCMLGGQSFGDAVKSARRDTYRYHPQTNTWGAYQCYGDPSFKLYDEQPTRSGSYATWVSPVRAIHQLENIRSRARTGSDPARLRADIEKIEGALAERYPTWLMSSKVREALGRAWAELATPAGWTIEQIEPRPGQPAYSLPYDKAIENLSAALSCEDGEVGYDVRGDLSNLEVRGETAKWRLRRQRALRGPEASAAIEAIDQEAEEKLSLLLKRLEAYAEMHPTSKRWTQVGSAAKRLAAVQRGQDRTETLNKAHDVYGKATERSRLTCGSIAPYPAGNVALIKVVRRLAKGNRSWTGIEGLLSELEAERPVTSFWDHVVPIQVDLVRVLMDVYRGQDAQIENLMRGLRTAHRNSASSYQIALLGESLDTLIDILDDRWEPSNVGKKRLAEARRIVQKLRSELAALVAAQA